MKTGAIAEIKIKIDFVPNVTTTGQINRQVEKQLSDRLRQLDKLDAHLLKADARLQYSLDFRGSVQPKPKNTKQDDPSP